MLPQSHLNRERLLDLVRCECKQSSAKYYRTHISLKAQELHVIKRWYQRPRRALHVRFPAVRATRRHRIIIGRLSSKPLPSSMDAVSQPLSCPLNTKCQRAAGSSQTRRPPWQAECTRTKQKSGWWPIGWPAGANNIPSRSRQWPFSPAEGSRRKRWNWRHGADPWPHGRLAGDELSFAPSSWISLGSCRLLNLHFV